MGESEQNKQQIMNAMSEALYEFEVLRRRLPWRLSQEGQMPTREDNKLDMIKLIMTAVLIAVTDNFDDDNEYIDQICEDVVMWLKIYMEDSKTYAEHLSRFIEVK